MARIRVVLREFLKNEGISEYKFANNLKTIKPSQLYAIAAGRAKPSLEALEDIYATASRLLKRPVRLDEILQIEQEGIC